MNGGIEKELPSEYPEKIETFFRVLAATPLKTPCWRALGDFTTPMLENRSICNPYSAIKQTPYAVGVAVRCEARRSRSATPALIPAHKSDEVFLRYPFPIRIILPSVCRSHTGARLPVSLSGASLPVLAMKITTQGDTTPHGRFPSESNVVGSRTSSRLSTA